MSKDRSGLYNIYGTVFQVIRGVAGDCLSLGDHDGGILISGPKPWDGGTIIAEFEVDEEYGPIERIGVENAKLRELSKYAILCSEGDVRCMACPYHDKAAEPHIICTMRKAAVELGVEIAL